MHSVAVFHLVAIDIDHYNHITYWGLSSFSSFCYAVAIVPRCRLRVTVTGEYPRPVLRSG